MIRTWLCVLLAACSNPSPSPAVNHVRDLATADGREIRIVGRYVPVATAKGMSRPGRPSPRVELGEVVIEIEGEAATYDRTAPDGATGRIRLGEEARSTDEIARFRDRRVSVTGRFVLAPVASDRGATTKPEPILLEPRDLHVE